jgi:hypothetical protein
LEGSGCDLIKVPSHDLPGGAEKNHKKLSKDSQCPGCYLGGGGRYLAGPLPQILEEKNKNEKFHTLILKMKKKTLFHPEYSIAITKYSSNGLNINLKSNFLATISP